MNAGALLPASVVWCLDAPTLILMLTALQTLRHNASDDGQQRQAATQVHQSMQFDQASGPRQRIAICKALNGSVRTAIAKQRVEIMQLCPAQEDCGFYELFSGHLLGPAKVGLDEGARNLPNNQRSIKPNVVQT